MKNGRFILTIAAVVIINILAFWAWFYFVSAIWSQTTTIKAEKQKMAATEEELKNAALLKNLVNEVQNDKEAIDSFFINKDTAINFIENLESIADKANVSSSVGSSNIDEAADNLNLQINLKGEFSQIFQYLTLLENTHYIIDVTRLNLLKSNKIWEASLEISLRGFRKT